MPTSTLSTAPVSSSVWEDQQFTHTPFLCSPKGRFVLLFARSFYVPRRVPHYSPSGTNRVWRLAWAAVDPASGACGAVHSIRTGLVRKEVECSPCLSTHAGQVHLSFIGTLNHGTGRLEHALFRMSGPELSQLGNAVRVGPSECFAGFWRPDLSAMNSGRDGTIRLQGSVKGAVHTGFHEIGRVSFDADHPSRLLITGSLPGEALRLGRELMPRTIVYDIDRDSVLGEIRINGESVYKPTLSAAAVAHVVPHQRNRRRAWQIKFQRQFSLVPTCITARRAP